MGQKFEKMRQNFFWGLTYVKNNIGHVFSFKNFFLCVFVLKLIVAKLPWKQGLESTQMKTFLNEKNMANVIFWHMCDPRINFASFFQIFGPFLGIYPPCLWFYLKKFPAQHFKIIKYQCTIVTLTRWDWFWV